MSFLFRLLLLITLHCFCAGPLSFAQSEVDELSVQIETLDRQIEQLELRRKQLLEDARQQRILAADFDRDLNSLMGRIDRIEALRAGLDQQRENIERSNKEVEKAQEALKAAEEALQTAKKQAELASQQLVESEEELKRSAPELPDLKESSAVAKLKSQSLHEHIQSLEFQSSSLQQSIEVSELEIENLLRSHGRWISFKEQIAPIFQNRCVPCHNSRNAQGRYNMASYSTILGSGESGPSIDAGDADSSSLYQFVLDGWMPFETAPLPDEEVELIRKWIDLGARLESSVEPDAPLIRIMPRPEQPLPPETYPATFPITALAVSPANDFVLSSGYHELLLWSQPEVELAQRIPRMAERVYGLDFHHLGKVLAVATGTPGRIGEVKIVDRATAKPIAELLVSDDVVFDVAFAPSEQRVATAAADGTVAVFDLDEQFEVTKTLYIQDHADWVSSVAWSSDGESLVTASRDKTCKIFDARTGKLQLTYSEHQQPVSVAIFSSDNKRLISGGDDGKVRIWSAEDGKQLHEVVGFNGSLVGLSLISKDQVVAVDTGGTVSTVNVTNGERLKRLEFGERWLSSAVFAEGSNQLYVGDQAGLIQAVDIGSWTKELEWLAAPQSR